MHISSLTIIPDWRLVTRGDWLPLFKALKKEISGDIVTVGLHQQFHGSAKTLFQSHESFIREVIPGEEELKLFVDRGESALPQILRLLDQANIQLETIQMSIPSLNDVFLKKTGRYLREGEKK